MEPRTCRRTARTALLALAAATALSACGGGLSLPEVSAGRSSSTEAPVDTATDATNAAPASTTVESSVPVSSVPAVTLPLDTVAPATTAPASTPVAAPGVDYSAGVISSQLTTIDGATSRVSFTLGEGAVLQPADGNGTFVVVQGTIGQVPLTLAFIPTYGGTLDDVIALDHDPAQEIHSTRLLDGSMVGVVQELSQPDGTGRHLYAAAVIGDWSLQIALFPTPGALDQLGVTFDDVERLLTSTIRTFEVAPA
jgi:hypothetical protein